jgi:hypothetical protein
MYTAHLILAATAVALICMDGVLTGKVVGTPGVREVNPVLRLLIKRVGEVPALVVTRVAAVLVVALGALLFPGMTFVVACTIVVLLVFAYAVINNARIRT